MAQMIRRSVAVALALLAGLESIAMAPHPRSTATLWGFVTNAVYVYRPDPSSVEHFFPKHALAKGVSGSVLLRCTATATGGLKDCVVVAEAPNGWGFGEAAVRSASMFDLDPRLSDGTSIEGRTVPFPIRFHFEGVPPPPLNLFPGNLVVLVTPLDTKETEKKSKTATLDCPTRADRQRRCLAHRIEWASRPNKVQSMAMLAAADQGTGLSMLICTVAAKGALTDCAVSGEATPKTKAAILSLVPLFKAPARSTDNVRTLSGHLLVTFNWPLLRLGQAAATNDPSPNPKTADPDD
jgi:TonB family protein